MHVDLLTDDTSLFPPFRYLYGEPVQGTAYVVFGVTVNKEQIRLPAVKQVSNVSWANKQPIYLQQPMCFHIGERTVFGKVN